MSLPSLFSRTAANNSVEGHITADDRDSSKWRVNIDIVNPER